MLTPNPQYQRLECPKCGKYTIVQHNNVYRCLNCRFRRDFSEFEPTSFGLAIAAGLILLTLIVLL